MAENHNDIQFCDDQQAGQIVLYQPDDTVSLEVKVDGENDTVWLTQAQMAELFQRERSVIAKHINSVFKEGELEENSNVQILHNTLSKYKPTKVYSLNVIISVGYRVRSKRGTQFRIWATNVLRDYLLHGYSINRQLIAMQERTDERFLQIEQKLDKQQQQVDFLVRLHDNPSEQLFPTGCVFDAWEYVSALIRSAKNTVTLIDNFCNERTLALLAKRAEGVKCTIHTRFSEAFNNDIEQHNKQYAPISKVQLPHQVHDRFLIIDGDVYIMGDSMKGLGHSLTAVLKTGFTPEEILSKLK